MAALAFCATDAVAGAPVAASTSASVSADTESTGGLSDGAGKLFEFDIPAQPLTQALNRYADVSKQPALFPSDIAGARMSSPIHGRYSPEAALRLMLQGTGLTAEKRDSTLGQTFVLKETGDADADMNAPARIGDLFDKDGYPGLVQQRIWQSLCANPRTAPGRYSSVLRFRVDASGRVNDARLLGTSGDARRDAALLAVLRQVQIDSPPPPAIVQHSLAMMILPVQPGTANGGPRCNPPNAAEGS